MDDNVEMKDAVSKLILTKLFSLIHKGKPPADLENGVPAQSSIGKQAEKDTIQSKTSQTPEEATAELVWSASEDVKKELRNKLDKAATAQKESEDKAKKLRRELHKAATTQRELRGTVLGLESDNRELRAVQTRILGEANKKYQSDNTARAGAPR